MLQPPDRMTPGQISLQDFLRCHTVRADPVGEVCRKILADPAFPWKAHRGSRTKQWQYIAKAYTSAEATAYRDLIRGLETL